MGAAAWRDDTQASEVGKSRAKDSECDGMIPPPEFTGQASGVLAGDPPKTGDLMRRGYESEKLPAKAPRVGAGPTSAHLLNEKGDE